MVSAGLKPFHLLTCCSPFPPSLPLLPPTSYLPGPNLIKFGIESKRSASNTATHAFKVRIWDALVEMRSFCEQANVSEGGEGVAVRMGASARL
jgi:hypothetical protein